MVSMRYFGGRYEAPYEALKHVKGSVNGRLDTIQPEAQNKRGQINLTWFPKQSVKSLSLEGGLSVQGEVVKKILNEWAQHCLPIIQP